MTRLVSAYYRGAYPFAEMDMFTEVVSTSDPNDLRAGDVLVVWGGGDIPNQYYGKARSSKSWASDTPNQRDEVEWALINRAVELGCVIIGVCRGGQMLCAKAGGYLIQHITGHGGTHLVKTFDDAVFPVNSIHHQMMMPEKTKHKLLAWSKHKLSREYWDEDEVVDVEIEPEYIYFDEIRGHAIQWHPEGLRLESQANQYVINKIKEYM